MWTLDELVERVRAALAAEYPGAPNGRVRDVPDRRAIRWYTTIGLVDRPLGMRGRTALYGPRHLQQLVAIKRRQAEGRSLAEIQFEFSWITDDGLRLASRIPDQLLTDDGALTPDDPAATPRPRFWTHSPSDAAEAPGFHGHRPPFLAHAGSTPAATEAVRATVTSPSPPNAEVAAGPAAAGDPGGRPASGTVSGVALGCGVILLVPRPVSDRDRGDIAAAAAPLLDLLASRGLTDGSSS